MSAVTTAFAEAQSFIDLFKKVKPREGGGGYQPPPLGRNFKGRLVKFVKELDKEDATNLEGAQIHYVIQFTESPTASEWVGRSIHDWAGLRTYQNDDGSVTNRGVTLTGLVYSKVMGLAWEALETCGTEFDAMVAKVGQLAEAGAIEVTFDIAPRKNKPEKVNIYIKEVTTNG